MFTVEEQKNESNGRMVLAGAKQITQKKKIVPVSFCPP